MNLKRVEKLLREFDFPEDVICDFLTRYEHLQKTEFEDATKEFFNATAEDLNSTYCCQYDDTDNR